MLRCVKVFSKQYVERKAARAPKYLRKVTHERVSF
jgi:hypothetical protein